MVSLSLDLIQDLQHQLFREFGCQDMQRMRHRDWTVGVEVLEHLHDSLVKEEGEIATNRSQVTSHDTSRRVRTRG